MRRDVTRSDQSMLEKMMEYLDCYFMKGPQVLPTKRWIIDLTTHRENSKTWKPCVCTSFWHLYSSIYRQICKEIITYIYMLTPPQGRSMKGFFLPDFSFSYCKLFPITIHFFFLPFFSEEISTVPNKNYSL